MNSISNRLKRLWQGLAVLTQEPSHSDSCRDESPEVGCVENKVLRCLRQTCFQFLAFATDSLDEDRKETSPQNSKKTGQHCIVAD